MTKHPMIVAFFVIVPVTIAAGLLSKYTIGESLVPHHETAEIGVSVALLVMATAVSLLFLSNATEKPGSHLGVILIICGTVCILIALALQFYLASVTASNSQRMTDILRERGGNVNLNFGFPKSVEAIGYFALFAGAWLAAVGIRIGVNRDSAGTANPSTGSGQ